MFPARDFVALDGWPASTQLNIRVLRDGFEIGSAVGRTDASGFLEVNHPGGVCWVGSTPNLIAGDVVQAAANNPDFDTVGGDVDQTVTGYVKVTTHAFRDGPNRIVMKGTAQAMDANGAPAVDASGNPLPAPLGQLEARIVAPDMKAAGFPDRDLNAPGGIPGEYTGTLDYDAPGSTHWTAVFEGPGLDDTIAQIAVDGESRIMHWMDTDPAGGRLGLTLYEDGAGVADGPGMPDCPPGANMGVTGSTPATVNATNINNATNLRLNGVARSATDVWVTLDDEANPLTDPIRVQATINNPGAVNQTWFANIPMNDLLVPSVAQFSDGPLTASAEFTVGERQVGTRTVDNGDGTTSEVPIMEPIVIGGAEKTIIKDLTVPEVPIATPAEGRYPTSQSVELSQTDGFDARIRYTRNGTVPTLTNGSDFTADILVTADQTIKARVYDAAGNASPVAPTCAAGAASCNGWYRYFIGGPPAAPSVPDLLAADDSGESSTDDITSKQVLTFTGTAEPNVTVNILDGGVVVGTGTSSSTGTYSVQTSSLATGGRTIQAQASNAFGNSNPSATLGVTIDTAAPTASADVPAGLYNQAQSVALSSSEAGTILYSRTTTTPDTVYTAPLTIASTTTLVFNAADRAGNTSANVSRTYTIDTTNPVVSLTAPVNGATVSGNVTLSANASDANGIRNVEFRVDGNAVNTDATAPYSFAWPSTSVPNGAHSISAVATDNAGNSAPVANGVAVTVNNTTGDVTNPTASFVAPAAGANVQGAAVTISANANDNVGVVGVQFFDGTTLIADDTTRSATQPNYSVTWDTTPAAVAAGAHTLRIVARDAAGNTVTVTRNVNVVKQATATAPTVTAVNNPTLRGNLAATAGQVPFAISWAASNGGSAITDYNVQRSADSGTTWTGDLTATPATGTTLNQSLAPGTYLYRVRATNAVGTSAFVNSRTFVLRVAQETPVANVTAYTGTWTQAALTGSFGGSVRWSSTAGNLATHTFTGEQVAWVSTLGTDRGAADVRMDSATAAATQVTLTNGALQARRVAYVSPTLTSGVQHTIRVNVRATTTAAKRVDVDAFLVLDIQ